jgi:hypothetical protein
MPKLKYREISEKIIRAEMKIDEALLSDAPEVCCAAISLKSNPPKCRFK